MTNKDPPRPLVHLAPWLRPDQWIVAPHPDVVADRPRDYRFPEHRPIAARMTYAEARASADQASRELDYADLEQWGREPSISEQIEAKRVRAGLGPLADAAAWHRQYLAQFPRPEDPGPAIELLRREIIAGRLSLSMVTTALQEAEREARQRPRKMTSEDMP